MGKILMLLQSGLNEMLPHLLLPAVSIELINDSVFALTLGQLLNDNGNLASSEVHLKSKLSDKILVFSQWLDPCLYCFFLLFFFLPFFFFLFFFFNIKPLFTYFPVITERAIVHRFIYFFSHAYFIIFLYGFKIWRKKMHLHLWLELC